MSERDRTPEQAAAHELNDAITKGAIEDVKALIDAGADVNAENYYKIRPLFFAIQAGKEDVVRLLLAWGADANKAVHGDGRKPLYFAAGAGNEEMVAELIAADAVIDAVDQYGGTALGACASSLSALRLNLPNYETWRVEQDRAPTGLVAVAQMLILHGADVNIAAKRAYTPADFIRRARIPRLDALLDGRQKKKGWFS
jgi:ankyrin repeat protein